MNMEPSASSSAAATVPDSTKKRKRINPITHDFTKRLKTDEALQCGHPRRISVLADHLQQPITLNELTELLHYAALGKTGSLKKPSWCRLHCQKTVKAVNVVLVEGLTQSHFYRHYLTLQHLRTNYSTRVTFTPSSDNIASKIFSSEVPNPDCLSVYKPDNELHKALKTHPVISKFGTQRKGLTAYVLTQEEMIKKHYPVKGIPGYEEYVCTESDCLTDSSPLYGLDCEMCLTEKGHELTRVSVVDSDGNCVLDELVKPQSRIFNYLTKFSGITAAMLRPVKTTLRDVQAKLRMLLPGNAVLVGHSINNDLMALKLIHPNVIDTSLLYRREFGQKFKLKVLADIVLRRQIQNEEKNGHNPIEDALAALQLAQYFIQTGPLQVVKLHMEELWGYTLEETSDIDTDTPETMSSHRFADVLQTLGRSVAFLGKRCDIALDLSNQKWYSCDKEMLTFFRRQMECPFLSVLQLSSFSDLLKTCSPHPEQHYYNVCASLRDMCVLFAGPFPSGFTEREVRRLFCCCGLVRKVKMLNTSVRVHAEVEFELLEGALLASKSLNGLIVQGQAIKVQRPVYESMLDLDLTLDALRADTLNTNHLYAVKLSPSISECIPAKVNGHILGDKDLGIIPVKKTNGVFPTEINSKCLQPNAAKSKLSEEAIRETFSNFGVMERVILSAKSKKHARHACIKFMNPEGKHAALSASDDLFRQNFLICPSLTPPHLPSWVAMTAPVSANVETPEDPKMTHMQRSFQDQELDLMMKKLDRQLGKHFRSLPDGTLSVVVLLGHVSENGRLPGLCLMEVKQVS